MRKFVAGYLVPMVHALGLAGMALALADKNIRVNALAPGTIATELAAKAMLTNDEAKKRSCAARP